MERQLRAPPESTAATDREQRLGGDAFRLLVESTVDYAIFMLDTEGRVVSWNAGAERINGYRASEIIGQHFSVFYTADAKAREWPAHELREAARVGRFEDEGWRLRKDGSRFWANVVITALRDGSGLLRGFAQVTRDLTQRKAHEERIENLTHELRRRVEELAAANGELRQKATENEGFVSGVSHDLRAPLVNLQGFSQELTLTLGALKGLIGQPEVPAKVRAGLLPVCEELEESVGFIENAVGQLDRIIGGLLRLSRVGRVEYEFAIVDPGAVVADVLAATHNTVVGSGARIELRPLPLVQADRNALEQVFSNLIGNSLKNLDPARGGVVEISARRGPVPVFAVRDNGVGIPVENRGKIFQVFQPAHGSQAGRGEGIGLAMVRRIVERHGGRIWFESEPGAGATFFFTLAPGTLENA